MVLGVHTTAANQHDSQRLCELIKKTPNSYRREVMSDKGYKSKTNDQMLKAQGSKGRIMHKAYRNTPLTSWQIKYNKACQQNLLGGRENLWQS